MVSLLLIAGFLFAAGTVLFSVPPLCRTAVRRSWIDEPDGERKLHDEPIPSAGGVTIAGGIGAGVLFFLFMQGALPFELDLPSWPFWAGAGAMVLIGFYDDLVGITFRKKFFVQILAAYALLHAGFVIDASSLLPFISGDPFERALIDIPVTMLWIVGIVNAVNLLDGLDGLAAGVALIAFISMGTVFALQGEAGTALFALIVAGALMGFLRYNANPASIFMGDSGSLLLGFLLAAYPLQSPAHTDPLLAFFVPVLALGLPLLDTGVSMFRRFIRGRSVFMPDRDHIHHRLERNTSHRKAVYTLYLVSALFGAAAVLLVVITPHRSLMLITTVTAGAYVWLRTLGYLRLRKSWRAVRKHYSFSANGTNGAAPASREVPANGKAAKKKQTVTQKQLNEPQNGHSKPAAPPPAAAKADQKTVAQEEKVDA